MEVLILRDDQLANIDDALADLSDKKLILNTAIDIQALLGLLVEKEVVTKEEVDAFREKVRRIKKYRLAMQYINQTEAEIERYQSSPQEHLKEMFRRKTNR